MFVNEWYRDEKRKTLKNTKQTFDHKCSSTDNYLFNVDSDT